MLRFFYGQTFHDRMKKRKPKMNFYKTQQHRNAPACIEVIAISDRPENLNGWVCRSDWSTFEAAHEVAEAASIFEGVEYIAIDRGAYTSPRFDVIRAPQVLDPVSYSFNCDSYPCGYIKTISKSLKKITTTTGETFYRRKQTGAWLMNRQWSMIAGHIEERNPHF
jgi:hypothetical protein